MSDGGAAGAGPLSPAERRLLLRTAREAIEACLAVRPLETLRASGRLAGPGGAFVSLHRRADDELRGCIGRLQSDEPLLETVAQMAAAAATQDRRFAPVRLAELPTLAIEVSVLGPLVPIAPAQVEVGRHGLIVGDGRRRGVLLPQVAVDHGWDKETFLAHTCLKAGLSAETWRRPGIELQAFTAEVFGEDE